MSETIRRLTDSYPYIYIWSPYRSMVVRAHSSGHRVSWNSCRRGYCSSCEMWVANPMFHNALVCATLKRMLCTRALYRKYTNADIKSEFCVPCLIK